MKKIIIPIGAIFISGMIQAQLSTIENYVQSRTYLEPTTTSSSTAKQIETVQYFDGLGRPKQIVNVKASPQGKDIVTPIVYDGFGRQVLDYLPVPQQGTNGGGIYTQQTSGYFPVGDPTGVYTNEKPFSEKILESSPLDRVLQQKQVGAAWDNKPVQFGYDANTTGDAVKKYTTVTTWVDGATNSELSQSTNYGTAQLYKNTVTDEDGNITIEFKNGEGQVLLVRKMISDTEKADTYYVYNEYNQLAFVISPKAAIETDPNTVLGDLCYQYKYDSRGRLVEKKIPGKGWEYMVYDKADRIFMTQDANMRPSGNWLLTRYDKLSRVIYTAIAGIGNTYIRKDIQDAVNFHSVTAASLTEERTSAIGFTKNGMDIYYGNNTYPTTAILQVLSINYYDTYPPGTPSIPSQILGQDVLPQDTQNSPVSTKSLPVASYVKNIEDDNWTKSYTWYDKKGRAVRTHSINHLGGYTNVETMLDFAGIVQQSITHHKRLDTDTERIITENFTYDSQNRLLTHTHKVDNNFVEILAQNTYNELSQLSNKKVGGTILGNGLQTVDYSYNIRGWMTKINDPANLNGKLFGYELRYNNPISSNITAGRFNGNITEIDWNNGSENLMKRYNYDYDKLNRLASSYYREPSTGVSGSFNEYLTYDLNGNINTLKRFAPQVFSPTPTLIDDLVYQYTGNRLDKVIENMPNSTGYEGGNNVMDYDLNGSMINMKDKGIDWIGYNYLNLPTTYEIIENNSGAVSNVTLSHLYRADGVKLRKTYKNVGPRGYSTTTNMTDYLDGFQYSSSETTQCTWCRTSVAYEEQAFQQKDVLLPAGGGLKPPLTPSSTWILSFVPTAEGFYSFTENLYIYQYRDHLGNARVSYKKDSNGELQITDTNNYYAFGSNHIGGLKSSLGGYQNYKYNGKELQETGMYDYGARFYMPDIGRWGVVDPLAEKMTMHSPYSYAFNNPVIFIDPDGMEPVGDYYNKLGKYLGSDGKNDNKVYVADNRNSDGSFSNAKELNTTHSQFQIMSNIIKAESSGNPMESLMLAHVANNAVGDKDVNYKGNEGLYQMLTDGNYSTTSSSDRTTPLSTGNGSDAANGARSAVISVLTGGKDPTGGAVLWDGIDFLKKGMDHNKFKEYSYISITSNVLGNFIRNAETNYNKVNPNWSLNSVFRSSSINPATGKCGPWCYTTSRWTGVGNSKRPFELQGTSSAGMSIFWKVKK
ncbi:DUF6443 domain-containing protein [uncultured Chryseobacterium sp.]|uniref:DUF6443 domain-containing protein n=1 Tax=uncultured Chryseobacterium sp. TaxID=259322 RepID=UPI0025FD71D8|nr:DUF6443 domain-containing protein [uncultured Chryseobacterium sp.]